MTGDDMMNGSEYIAGLKKLRRKVYIQGELAAAPMEHPLVLSLIHI